MSTEIIVALITSLFTFGGVIITVIGQNRKNRALMKEQSDLTLYRIEQLEKKQDKHNTLIERMYEAEDEIHVLRTRVDNIENKGE